MKKYRSLFRIRFIYGLQYRAAALAGIVTQFAFGFLFILMYSAFYREDPSVFPMEFPQLTSYIWLQQALISLFAAWMHDSEILTVVSSGNISYELVRPVDLYRVWFTRSLALRFSRMVLRCFPILLICFILPAPYALSAPVTVLSFFLFLVTAVLGCLVAVAMSMLIYIAVLRMISGKGIQIMAVVLLEFLSGAVIPLPFFPEGFRQVAELLPFAYIQNLPLRIYSGSVAGGELIWGIWMQILWLILLILAGKIWMGRSLKKVVIQGG